jgi:thioredoxin 1
LTTTELFRSVCEEDEEMSGEHKQFTLDEDEELRLIKEKKLRELMGLKETKPKMSLKPVHVTDVNFNETVNKHSLALIDCWAPWCAPCVVIAPIIEEFAKEYAGKVLVGRLNVDENPRTARSFQIFGIPTLLLMKNGKEVDRIVGLVPKNHIEARLKKHLE